MPEIGALGVGLALAALLADAALSDLHARRIPNRVPVLIVILFAAAAPWGLPPRAIFLHVAAGATLLAAGAALFAGGIWGGGDAKLAAAVGTWTGFAAMPRFLTVMALSGGVLALLVLGARALAPRAADAPRPAPDETGHLPYGVALAVGGYDWLLHVGLTG